MQLLERKQIQGEKLPSPWVLQHPLYQEFIQCGSSTTLVSMDAPLTHSTIDPFDTQGHSHPQEFNQCNPSNDPCNECNLNLKTKSRKSKKDPSYASRKYKCTECEKLFTRPSTLRNHMNTHLGAKPFHCPNRNCEWKFSILSNMRRHWKICKVKNTADI